MRYFRHRILTELRWTVYLTRSRQKVTLLAFLMFALPFWSAALCVAWGSSTSSKVVAAIVGFVVGSAFSWLLPRAIERFLNVLESGGVFLRDGEPQNALFACACTGPARICGPRPQRHVPEGAACLP